MHSQACRVGTLAVQVQQLPLPGAPRSRVVHPGKLPLQASLSCLLRADRTLQNGGWGRVENSNSACSYSPLQGTAGRVLGISTFRASTDQGWLAWQVGRCNLLRPQCFLQTGGKGC